MRTTKISASLGAAALALAIAAPGIATNEDHKNNHRFAGHAVPVTECTDGDSVVGYVFASGDETLWPPNHKYAPYDITGNTAEDGSGDDATYVWSTLTHDEYVTGTLPGEPGEATNDEESEQNGSGNTIDDGRPFFDEDNDDDDGSAATFHEIRAERSGRGDGRDYTFRVWLDFDNDDMSDCSGDFTVSVPHDMGQGAENKTVHAPGDDGEG